MKVLDAMALATRAVSANASRPATAVIHDSPDARVVVFRIEPGQSVPLHTSPSTVLLSVLSGHGIVSSATDEHDVKAGDLIAYDPRAPHGMRATDSQLVLMAIIAPRPGDRSGAP